MPPDGRLEVSIVNDSLGGVTVTGTGPLFHGMGMCIPRAQSTSETVDVFLEVSAVVDCDGTGCCDGAKGYTLPPGTLGFPTPRSSPFGSSGLSPENP